MRPTTIAAMALAAVTACQRPAQPEGQAASAEAGLPATVLRNRLRGVHLGTPQAKPDIRLTTVDGQPFNLIEDTRGTLTLFFFGYTHCPDVCPVHVANVGKVMNTLPDEVTSTIRFVFVTTDPEAGHSRATEGVAGELPPGHYRAGGHQP